jgi:hypothetical protein
MGKHSRHHYSNKPRENPSPKSEHPPVLQGKKGRELNTETASADTQKEAKKKEKPMKRISDAKLTDWLIVVFTAVLACVGIVQGCELVHQAKIMERSARPYLMIYTAFTNEWAKSLDPIPMGVNVHVVNNTVYPAKALIAQPKLLIGPDALKEAEKCKIDYSSASQDLIPPVNPNTKNDLIVPTLYSAPLTTQDKKRIADHVDQVVIYGGIKYSGVAGEDFETQYCVQFNPQGYPWGSCGCEVMK